MNNEMSHLEADYEIVRTLMLRRALENEQMLQDALHALRNGAPHVTDEFIERTIARLGNDVQYLREASRATQGGIGS